MSATAVLANPSRRNKVSAVSTIRARVSSGLGLICGLIGEWLARFMNSDDLHNSSLIRRQVTGSEKSAPSLLWLARPRYASALASNNPDPRHQLGARPSNFGPFTGPLPSLSPAHQCLGGAE